MVLQSLGLAGNSLALPIQSPIRRRGGEAAVLVALALAFCGLTAPWEVALSVSGLAERAKFAPSLQSVLMLRSSSVDLDMRAVRRKFLALDQESFLDESEADIEERQKLRKQFEQMDDFQALFWTIDEEYRSSEQTPLHRLEWALHEQALVEAMSDGSIIRQPRTAERAKKRLREKTEEELAQMARQQAKTGRKRRGKRRFGGAIGK
eukprot:TRINITY_DN52704_c0_g1_i1.p1 TRINITY_DN52704_c0_g1~~TRINITY_DN52704_c0_g1_i1.p1  ORF type:complete len:217 (-),score=47.16 TRINITY_DN52704_c0_g1_i1:66-686(-)